MTCRGTACRCHSRLELALANLLRSFARLGALGCPAAAGAPACICLASVPGSPLATGAGALAAGAGSAPLAPQAAEHALLVGRQLNPGLLALDQLARPSLSDL